MTPPDTKPGRRAADAVLLVALAGGCTYAEAAATAGVSVSTVDRRMTDRSFRYRLDAIRAQVLARAADKLAASSISAVSAIEELIEPHNPPTVRLAAARALLDQAARYRAAADLDMRVAALDEALRRR